ncbi:MAG: transglycosylase domain-containing protein [Bacteroidetes bacterium]|nr:transglycosylase domain-containing protein [Bacteroidota bacterium]
MQSQQLIKNNGMLEMLLISGEDHRFKYRFGFDVIAIIRALKNRVIHNRVEGASTIEQQLVRVLTSDFNKTLKRKIKEIFLSTVLCELVPRKDIPTIYLYVAYYGTGMRGLEQVFKKFGITKSQTISNEMCAEIIARIKYPEPQKRNEKRLRQIEMRKKHLLALYNKHRLYKKFKIYD